MEIKFNVKELLPVLNQVSGMVNPKPTIPIFGTMLFESNNEELKITVSDSENWLAMKASCVGDDVKFCVNALDFVKVARNLNDIDLTIKVNQDNKTLHCSYGRGKFTLPYDDAKEWVSPTYSKDDMISVQINDGKALLNAIDKVEFAISNNDLKPTMSGAFFDFKLNGFVCVATDGYKLAVYKDNNIKCEEERNFIFPQKPLKTISSLLNLYDDNCTITFNDKVAIFKSDKWVLLARLIEGKYPNYEYVIPKSYKFNILINKEQLIAAIRRVLPLGNANVELLTMRFANNILTVSAEDIDFSKSATEEIDCDYNDEVFNIGFKGSGVLQVLSHIDGDTATFEFIDPQKACVVYGVNKDGYMSLLMPVLISSNE